MQRTRKHWTILDADRNAVGCALTSSGKRIEIIRRAAETVGGTIEQTDRAECPFCGDEELD